MSHEIEISYKNKCAKYVDRKEPTLIAKLFNNNYTTLVTTSVHKGEK